MNTLCKSLTVAALAVAAGYAFPARAEIFLSVTDGVHTGAANDAGSPGVATFSDAIGNFTASIDAGVGFPAAGSAGQALGQ